MKRSVLFVAMAMLIACMNVAMAEESQPRTPVTTEGGEYTDCDGCGECAECTGCAEKECCDLCLPVICLKPICPPKFCLPKLFVCKPVCMPVSKCPLFCGEKDCGGCGECDECTDGCGECAECGGEGCDACGKGGCDEGCGGCGECESCCEPCFDPCCVPCCEPICIPVPDLCGALENAKCCFEKDMCAAQACAAKKMCELKCQMPKFCCKPICLPMPTCPLFCMPTCDKTATSCESGE